MTEPRHSLTPAEMADLNIVGARARMGGGDLAPISYKSTGAAVPWLVAVNIDPGATLTPAELADLRIIAARARADGGDTAPLVYTSTRLVAPWRAAIEMEGK